MLGELAITREKKEDGFTILFIDTNKAKWQGRNWKTLNEFGKRKFENYLILSRAKERLKIIYK